MKICSLYGAGFYYMPGTDTCLKVGGFVRAEINANAGGSFAVATSGDFTSNTFSSAQTWRSRAGVTLDARSQTEYGTLRSYFVMATTSTQSQSGAWSATAGNFNASGFNVGNPGTSGSDPYTRLWSNAAFIQFAGFTAGKTGSFFDFDLQPYSNQTNFWGSNLAGGGIEVFAYTAQFGNGLSASISAESANGHRTAIVSGPTVPAGAVAGFVTTWGYGNQNVPDIVGNLRIDQAWGSAQVMGAYHDLNANNATGAAIQAGVPAANTSSMHGSGWAAGAGVKFNLPMIGKGDYIQAQFTASNGASLYSASGAGSFALTSNNGLTLHQGPFNDAVVTASGGLDKTKAWSITGGFEHFWNTQWKTSLYGAYGKLSYSDDASNVLRPTTAAAGTSANWSYWQIGSRTVWTPVTNLDLSVEAMYNHLDTAWGTASAGAIATGTSYDNKSWVSGIFRVQRNFYP